MVIEARLWRQLGQATVRDLAPDYRRLFLQDAGLPQGHTRERTGMGWNTELADEIQRRLIRLQEIVQALQD